MNATTGLVGVFHLQGSSWDRTRRQFVTHARNPLPLETQVSWHCTLAEATLLCPWPSSLSSSVDADVG